MSTATMPDNRIHDLETLSKKLAQMRDELRLEIHLAKHDVLDRFHDVEDKWFSFESHLVEARKAAGEASDDVWEALKATGQEIQAGYEKVKKAL